MLIHAIDDLREKADTDASVSVNSTAEDLESMRHTTRTAKGIICKNCKRPVGVFFNKTSSFPRQQYFIYKEHVKKVKSE